FWASVLPRPCSIPRASRATWKGATSTCGSDIWPARCRLPSKSSSRREAVDSGGQALARDSVEVERDDRAASSIRHAMHARTFEVAVGDLAGAVEAGGLCGELFLGQLAFGDAEHAPHLMAVHRAHLAGKPGNRGDDEVAVRIDVEQVTHVRLRVADA